MWSWMILFFLVVLVDVGHCQNKVLSRKGNGLCVRGSLIRAVHAKDEFECTVFCSRQSSCLSVNFKHSGLNQGSCELNNKTLGESERKYRLKHPEYSYLELVKEQCPSLSQETVKEPAVNSCKILLEGNSSLPDGVYKIQDTSLKYYPVYCHMTNIPGCGSGGWTLAMKLDGNKDTFGYNSAYWGDNRTYEVQWGLEGLTDKETKLESYWNTPFTKICLGMKVNGVTKWIKLDYEATSLYSVIADGTFRATTAGRDAWKRLIDGSSLQLNCNIEGINVQVTDRGNTDYPIFVRLGVVSNNEDSCDSCDSFIGFGALFVHRYTSFPKTTGNFAKWAGDNGDKYTPATGYVLVQ